MKQKFIDYFMDVAERTSQLSYAIRLKVGAIIVKDDRIISIGYNGMPGGWNNTCEDIVWDDQGASAWLDPEEFKQKYPYKIYNEEAQGLVPCGLKTKPEVLHAESNAIAKLAKSSQSGSDASIFITHAPCLDCAKLIYQTGISSVYYRNSYRDVAGVEFLNKSGVNVTQHTVQN